MPDVTDTGSSGWQELIPGIRKAELTFTMFINSATLVATCGALEPGTSITATLNIGNTGKSFMFPGYTATNKIVNPCKDPVTIEVTASSSGSLTLPA